MLKKILYSGLVALVVGVAVIYYMWNKPHEAIGKADVTTTATELADDFYKDEDAAMTKYIGKDGKTIIVQVSGKITDVKTDTSGTTIALETSDPTKGVSCVLDKFTKQAPHDYKAGEEVKLKGLCTGRLIDVVLDRCVPVE